MHVATVNLIGSQSALSKTALGCTYVNRTGAIINFEKLSKNVSRTRTSDCNL